MFARTAAPLARASSLPELAEGFSRAAKMLGFRYHVISRIDRGTPGAGLELICIHYPEEWVRHYLQHDYASLDPVHRAALSLAAPYTWRSITGVTPEEQQVLDEAAQAGLTNGISVPIHEPDGSIVLVNLSAPGTVVTSASRLRLAHFISTCFHLELQRLVRARSTASAVQLTARQRECLTWVARGKTSWAIARLLEVSPHTVEYHLRSAMKLLDVTNRTAAAVQAAVLGLIRL